MKNSNKKGFTLIELLVVLAVVGVLSGIVMQSLSSARTKARNVQRLENVESIAKAFQVATTGTTNHFPSSGGVGPVCLGTTSTCWGGYPAAPNINTLVRSGLASDVIPRDPFFQSGMGDAYVYNSNVGTPSGAYLYWRMEEGSGASCGRGTQYALPGPPFLCMLHLGPGTP